MAEFVKACEKHSIKKAPTYEPYDSRNLQGKALQKWEKQKRVWATVQENIRRRMAERGTARVDCINMSQGPYQAREREERIGLVTNAVPSCVFTGFHTWQSTLRTDEADGAVRYLQVGAKSFPYALYGKITDKRRRDVEHPINTRVVYQGECIPVSASSRELNLLSKDTLPDLYGSSNYYTECLRKFLPENEQRVPHLLLPRAYLELCGQPPPWTTNPEDAAAARNPFVPALVHIQPRNKQSKAVQQEPETNKKRSRPVSAKDAELHADGVDFATLGTSEGSLTGVLTLDISTTRVLFFAQPGEFAHGSVTIKNTGTVTVYYSWEQFQPVTALDTTTDTVGVHFEDVEGENGNCGGVGGVEKDSRSNEVNETDIATKVQNKIALEESGHVEKKEVRYDGTDDQDRTGVKEGTKRLERIHSKVAGENVLLRSLAKRSALAKSFFFFSAQPDGVILPGDKEIFSFSLRAAFPGRFTQYYELLTVPAVSSRIIIELCAFVRDKGHSLEAISRPIADALDASAIADTQRVIINELATKKSIYEAVEIEMATKECIAAAKATEKAQEALLAKRRKAWLATTYLETRVPFNSAVYERLDALYQNLAQTMSTLGQPLHRQVWDGSTQTLQSDICRLRDAPSRNMLREAFNVLMRAGNVSENETETLDVLLKRAAGFVAFSTLAQHAGELSDSILVTVGLSAPRIYQPFSHVAHHQRSGGGAGSTGGRRAFSGGNTTASSTLAGGGSKSHSNTLRVRGGGAFSPDGSTERGVHFDKLGAFPEHPFADDPEAEAHAKEEFKARLFTGMRRLVGDAVDCFCSTLDSYRCTIEVACALPLLEFTARMRAGDIHIIQNATEMEVHFAVDAAPPRKKK